MFLTFLGLLSAKIASNHSKWPSKCKAHPCFYFLRHFCSGMRTNQNFEISFVRLTILPLLLFVFYLFFTFPFSPLPIFLLQLLAFYQASFEWKNFQESVNEARITYHEQANGGKGKFFSEFFTAVFCCIFQSPLTHSCWFRYCWKGLILLHNLRINVASLN